VWDVELHDEIVWNDGERITSDDVIFTVSAIQNPDTNSSLFATWQGVVLERISAREIRFILKTPYVYFVDNLSNLYIAPEHIFGTIPTANLRLSDYNLEPIGSGPYAFVSFNKRRDGFITHYRVTANERFIEAVPLIKDIEFRFFSSYDEAITSFNRRDIDGLGGLSIQHSNDIKISHQLFEFKMPRYYAVFFNSALNPILENADIRTALILGTDKEKLLNEILDMKGVVINGPLYPGMEGYNTQIDEQYVFSPETSAGIEELAFEVIVPDVPFLIATAGALAREWEALGVKLTPRVLSSSQITSEIIATRDYHMLLFGNILKNNPDIFSFWHSSERFRTGLNLAFYENNTVDTLLESTRKELHRDTRIRDIGKIQTLIVDDAPALFLFSPHYLYAGPVSLGGLTMKTIETPSHRFQNINEWYLKTARIFK
jgi:peptide/nickel transport system substrate-binding protein